MKNYHRMIAFAFVFNIYLTTIMVAASLIHAVWHNDAALLTSMGNIIMQLGLLSATAAAPLTLHSWSKSNVPITPTQP